MGAESCLAGVRVLELRQIEDAHARERAIAQGKRLGRRRADTLDLEQRQ